MAKDFEAELLEILSHPSENLKAQLSQYHEADIADVLQEMTPEQRKSIYAYLDNEYISDIFTYLDDPSEFFEELTDKQAVSILNEMDADDAMDVLEDMEEDDKKDIVKLLDKDVQEDLKMIASYEDDEIGSKITTNFITINEHLTIKNAMKKVIAEAPENDNISIIYVTNNENKYVGAIYLKDLIIARENTSLDTIIKTNYPSFNAKDKTSDILQDLQDYALDSIPILDDNNEIIGIITSDDVVDVVNEELTEDYNRLAAVVGDIDQHETVFQAFKKRMPWLLTLLVLGLLVSSLISSFESVISTVAFVVFFQSLILDMAGNVGTQSLAVTIRLLADEEESKRNLVKHVLKEVRIGFVNGLTLGIISFLFVLCFLLITKNNGQPIIVDGHEYGFKLYSFMVAGLVGISMLIAMIFSSLFGTCVPIFFKKIHVDPAVASGPFITTINDMIAVVCYYGCTALLFFIIF